MKNKINIVEVTKEQLDELKKELGQYMVKQNDLYIVNSPKGLFGFREIRESKNETEGNINE